MAVALLQSWHNLFEEERSPANRRLCMKRCRSIGLRPVPAISPWIAATSVMAASQTWIPHNPGQDSLCCSSGNPDVPAHRQLLNEVSIDGVTKPGRVRHLDGSFGSNFDHRRNDVIVPIALACRDIPRQ